MSAPPALGTAPKGIACTNGHPNAPDRLYCYLCLTPLQGSVRTSISALTTGSLRGTQIGPPVVTTRARPLATTALAGAIAATAVGFVIGLIPVRGTIDTSPLVVEGVPTVPGFRIEESCGSPFLADSSPSLEEFRRDSFAESGVTEQQFAEVVARDPRGPELSAAFDSWLAQTHRLVVKTCGDPLRQRRIIVLAIIAIGWAAFGVARLL